MAAAGDPQTGRGSVSVALLLAVLSLCAYKLHVLGSSGSLALMESYQLAGGLSPTQTVLLEDLTVLAVVLLCGLVAGRRGRKLGLALGWTLVVLYLLDIQAVRFFNARLTFPNLMRFALDLRHARGLLPTTDYVLGGVLLVVCVLLRRVQWVLPINRLATAALLVGVAAVPWFVNPSVGTHMILEQASLNMFRLNLQVVARHEPRGEALAELEREFPRLAHGVKQAYAGALLPEDGPGPSPDLVLLVSESLSRVDSKRSGGTRDRLPGIDGLQELGITFTHAASNGFNSSDALASLLLGADPLPTDLITGDMVERFPPERFAANNVVAAAKARGYTTIAISNAPLDFQHNDRWLREMGFDIVHGASSHRFADETIYSFGGPSDESLFEKAIQSLRSWPSPVFLMVFTVGLHKPYVLPDESDRIEGDLQGSMLAYVDRTTVQFHAELERSRFFQRGVLLMVGDHRRMDPLEVEEREAEGDLGAQGRVVATIIGRGVPAGVLDDTLLGHTDMNLLLGHLVRAWPVSPTLSRYSRALRGGLGRPMTYSVVDPDRGLVSYRVAGFEPQLAQLHADHEPAAGGTPEPLRAAEALMMLSAGVVGAEQGAQQGSVSEDVEVYGVGVLGNFEVTAAVLEDAAQTQDLDYSAAGVRAITRAVLDRLTAQEHGAWTALAAELRSGWEQLPELRMDLDQEAWSRAVLDRFLLCLTFEVTGQVPLTELKEQLVELVSLTASEVQAREHAVAMWQGLKDGLESGLELSALRKFHSASRGDGRADGIDGEVPGGGHVLAHMGALLERPENSMSAFHRALELGADGIECDLRLAADGTVFVMHDSSLRRMTGVDQNLRDLNREQVLKLRLRDPRFPGRLGSEPPALLSQVLDELPSDSVLWLELKPDEPDALADAVAALLEGHAHRNRLIVSSFAGRLVAPLAERFSDVRLALEFPRLDGIDVEALAQSKDAHRLVVGSRLASQLDPGVVKQLRAAGIQTSEFVPNRFDALGSAYSHGIDYLQTNRVERALRLRADRN